MFRRATVLIAALAAIGCTATFRGPAFEPVTTYRSTGRVWVGDV